MILTEYFEFYSEGHDTRFGIKGEYGYNLLQRIKTIIN